MVWIVAAFAVWGAVLILHDRVFDPRRSRVQKRLQGYSPLSIGDQAERWLAERDTRLGPTGPG